MAIFALNDIFNFLYSKAKSLTLLLFTHLDKFVSWPFATLQQTTITKAQEDITGESYQN